MRRLTLLGAVCLILALATGLAPTQLAANYCYWAHWSSQVNGCCGNKAKVNHWERLYCTGTGWQGSPAYAGYTCEAVCNP